MGSNQVQHPHKAQLVPEAPARGALASRPGSLARVRSGARRALGLAVLVALWAALAGCDPTSQAGEAPQEQAPAATVVSGVDASATALPADTPSPAENRPADTPLPPTATAAQAPPQAAPARPASYVVQEGDTLGAIAVQFDTTVDALVAANELASADLIQVGQTIRIVPPGQAAVASAPPTEPVVTLSPTARTAQAPAPARSPTLPAASEPEATARPTLQPALEPTAAPAVEPTLAPTAAAVSEPAPAAPAAERTPIRVNGRLYDAYNRAAIKEGQWFHYTCEFDAAWIVLKTYGFDVGLEEQVELVGLDTSVEPRYVESRDGIVIYGGDVTKAYSGDYKKNFLARSSGQAMRKVFEHYDLKVTAVRDRPSLEEALLRGELVWIKTTVDFKPWREATWIMPDGRSYQTVLGNDHALVVMGFNKDGVVIRDPLGPTSTNWQRLYEYQVPWARFMASWGAQEFDGLAVAPPGR